MNWKCLFLACLILCSAYRHFTLAQTTTPATQPVNLAGNWIWIQNGTFGTTGRAAFPNAPVNVPARSRPVLLVMTQEGEKLSGYLVNYGPNRPEIQNVSFKDGELSFQIIQVLNPQTAVRIGRPEREILSTYKGKVEGNTIRGRIWRGEEGDARSSEPWEATRQPVDPAPAEKVP